MLSVCPLAFFGRFNIIMAHRWFWHGQKRNKGFLICTLLPNNECIYIYTYISRLNTWWIRRISQRLCTAFAVHSQHCRCAVGTPSYYIRGYSALFLFFFKYFRSANVVLMQNNTALVLRSYHDSTAMVMRNLYVSRHDSLANAREITMTASRCMKKRAKAKRKHYDSIATNLSQWLLLKFPKHLWPPVTVLHSHATTLQQMQKHRECRVTLLQSDCDMRRIFENFAAVLSLCFRKSGATGK